jgi:hypothetical protein
MSWKSGGKILQELIVIIKDRVEDEDTRIDIYQDIITLFEDSDYDNFQDHIGEDSAYDSAYQKVFPEPYDVWNWQDEE